MRLTISSDGTTSRSFQVASGSAVFGRADDCDVVLDDPYVSHHHARIEIRSDGVWLVDLGSRNGVWLDGERVEASRRLPDVAELVMGSTVVRVDDAEIPQEREEKKTGPRWRQSSVLHLEASHAGATIGAGIMAVIFGVVALAALTYRTSLWPQAWRFDATIPDEALLIAAGVTGLFAAVAVLGAVFSGRRWHVERAIKRLSADPRLASIQPDRRLRPPARRASLIPDLEVRFVKPRKLPKIKPTQVVTPDRNVIGHRPLQIAYLRIFENRPRTRTFITSAWREFGEVWLLRSAASVTPAEYHAACELGDPSRMFISSPDQLDAVFHRTEAPAPRGRRVFRNVGPEKIRVRDRYGSYPVHALLCHGSFWKDAVDALLQRVDLVALDLSGFRPENVGTHYELQRVIDHFPIERVILLADEQSDTRFLDRQIHDAWGNMTMGSPNSGSVPRLAVVAITDYFHRSTSTSKNGSTSETVRLVSRVSDSRRVVAMAQHRVEETAAVAS